MNDTEFIKAFFFCPVDGIISNLIENAANNSGTVDIAWLKAEKKHPAKKIQKKEKWQEVVPEYTDDLFKEHFRMSRSTCSELVRIIEGKMPGRNDHFAELPKKVIFTIWYLANQEGFLASGKRFGFAKSTAYKVFREILSTLAIIRKKYVRFPDQNGCNKEALLFQRRSRGFPGVVGAIDICRISIKAPTKYRMDYTSDNIRFYLILQGISDHKGRFIDAFIGKPCQMNDAKGFEQSKIFKKLTDETWPLLPPNLHIVGDTAYPLLEHVMTPYRDNGHLTTQQQNYNVKLMACHTVNAQAFALLKATFKRLNYLEISNAEIGLDIILAACTLQNFLIDHKEIDLHCIKKNAKAVQVSNEIVNEMYVDEIAAAKRNAITDVLL